MRSDLHRFTGISVGLWVALVPLAATALDWEKLLMPGPLIEVHAALETDCQNCHSPLEKRAQKSLCLACHDDVALDVRTRSGFHGKLEGAREGDCRSCHSDHRGRTFDAVVTAQSHFDHAFTDFPLTGAHVSAECSSCHPSSDEKRQASSDCIACHSEDDAHDGELGDGCASCHGPQSWRSTDFDHDTTDFQLVGPHGRASCVSCHIDDRFEGTPTDCGSCHLVNDAHRGSQGTDCTTCHTVSEWSKGTFNHRTTDFPLLHAHADAPCGSCHVGPRSEQQLPGDCISCHRADDAHGGTRGIECETCHSEVGWAQSTFDHGRDTKFQLLGEHAETACGLCHVEAARSGSPPTDCVGCHGADDVHRGGEGEDCGKCHNAVGWTQKVRFDHDLSRFPLLGLHAVASCEACHATARFTDASTDCIDCHAAANFHQGTMGSDCSTCHTANDWGLWDFSHAQDTAFALHGAHEDVDCQGCHSEAAAVRPDLSKRCVTCHGIDDAHRGGFGKNCSRCHDEVNWRDAKFR